MARVAAFHGYRDSSAATQKALQAWRVDSSNIDNDLFAETGKKLLGVEVDVVVTAEQARSYKPSLHNFELALRTLGIPREQLLHAGQSVYHDVIPARSLGISHRLGKSQVRASRDRRGTRR